MVRPGHPAYINFERLAALGHADEATDALDALHLVLAVPGLLLQQILTFR
jgi:hypothetical protein